MEGCADLQWNEQPHTGAFELRLHGGDVGGRTGDDEEVAGVGWHAAKRVEGNEVKVDCAGKKEGEETAVLVEPGGTASVEGAGAAWFLRMRDDDVVACAPGEPLETGPIEVLAVRAGTTVDLATWSGDGERRLVAAVNGSVRRRDG